MHVIPYVSLLIVLIRYISRIVSLYWLSVCTLLLSYFNTLLCDIQRFDLYITSCHDINYLRSFPCPRVIGGKAKIQNKNFRSETRSPALASLGKDVAKTSNLANNFEHLTLRGSK